MKIFQLITGSALLLCCVATSQAQLLIKGKIVDSATGEPVSFATVGLKQANTGVNADEAGNFSITAPTPGDTIIVMNLGYQTFQQAAGNEFLNIRLTPSDLKLSEVQIVSKKGLKKVSLNEFRHEKIHKFISSGGYETQVAQYFKAPAAGVRLTSVTISISDDPTLKTSFRLRIYGVDEQGKPGADLQQKEILVHNDGQNLVTVDLDNYDVYVPNEAFFVAVEWIKTSVNANGGNSNVYRPIVGFSNKKSKTDNVWRLNYRNEWYQQPYSVSKGNMAITATVKY